MNNNYKIIDIFPTPIFYDSLPIEFSELESFFDSQELYTSKNITNPITFGERSKNSYILNLPELSKLSEYILSLAITYGNEILNYNYDKYKFSQSWLSLKYPNQHHREHNHPNSLISGVLYYGDFLKDTPLINFHKMEMGINSFILSPKQKQLGDNPKYSSNQYTLSIQPGNLILFPSYLVHSVPENNTDQVRKSLAFNIVPEGGFGEESHLTELKL